MFSILLYGFLAICISSQRYINPNSWPIFYFKIYCINKILRYNKAHRSRGNCHWRDSLLQISFLFKDFVYLFLKRGREREREEEKHQCVVAPCVPPFGDLACNSGIGPDWESNWRPFGSQTGAQSTEPHQPGNSLLQFSDEIGCVQGGMAVDCYSFQEEGTCHAGKVQWGSTKVSHEAEMRWGKLWASTCNFYRKKQIR